MPDPLAKTQTPDGDNMVQKAKTTKPITTKAEINNVQSLIKKNNLKIVDFKFNDLPGLWQHFSIPAKELLDSSDPNAGIWSDGIGFDGSSIRGFQKIQESDMVLYLDTKTAVVDPACEVPTASIICNVFDPINKVAYTRDPRFIAQKAEEYLKSTGIADTSYWGPEYEFFLFDDVKYSSGVNHASYSVDSVEGIWNSGRDEQPNLGYKIRHKEGYFPVPPHDTLQDIRSHIINKMIETGIPVEVHHHEVATAGQNEIDMRYGSLVEMADNCMMYKYIVKNMAREFGMVATFMPKPLYGDNGSGMHTHQSLWKDGKNLFFDAKGYGMISQMAKYYIGGLLKHANALMAFCAPSTNSYKRLVPGYEAPVNLVYSLRNRSAAVRIPMYSENPKSKRIEFRPPDPMCNPYLSFSALLMAGLDGIKNKMDPGQPFEGNTYELEGKAAKKIPTVPGSLEQAIDALEADHKFLLEGGVFTQDVIDVWIAYKREEMEGVRLRPHPWEFQLYFDM